MWRGGSSEQEIIIETSWQLLGNKLQKIDGLKMDSFHEESKHISSSQAAADVRYRIREAVEARHSHYSFLGIKLCESSDGYYIYVPNAILV